MWLSECRGYHGTDISFHLEADGALILDYLGMLSDPDKTRTEKESRVYITKIALLEFFKKAAEELPEVRNHLKEARYFKALSAREKQQMLRRIERIEKLRRGSVRVTKDFPIPGGSKRNEKDKREVIETRKAYEEKHEEARSARSTLVQKEGKGEFRKGSVKM